MSPLPPLPSALTPFQREALSSSRQHLDLRCFLSPFARKLLSLEEHKELGAELLFLLAANGAMKPAGSAAESSADGHSSVALGDNSALLAAVYVPMPPGSSSSPRALLAHHPLVQWFGQHLPRYSLY